MAISHTFCNSPPINKNKFAGGASFNDNKTFNPAVSYAQTPILTEASTLVQASVLAQTPSYASVLIISFTDKLYQQLVKIYIIIVKLLGYHQGVKPCK